MQSNNMCSMQERRFKLFLLTWEWLLAKTLNTQQTIAIPKVITVAETKGSNV